VTDDAQRHHWWKHCARCGDRIGIYEPVLVEHPDGFLRTAFLNLDPLQRIGPWLAFHPHCVVADEAAA